MEELQMKVGEAVRVLNHDSESCNRIAANQWLVQFQHSDAAWEVATSILTSSQHQHFSNNSFEVHFFAAQILKRKIQNEGCYLQPGAKDALLSALLVAAKRFSSGPQQVKEMASNHVVKVRREVIAEIMTCPICHKFFREATTISECLHTFCRKCIHKKLSDEELENCPVCDIDLGCSPLEKLRRDHNLQDIRAKIFPFRKKEKAPETPPSVTPVRRKERSLSSLVVDTPRVSLQTSKTGKRTKATPRKTSSLRGPYSHLEKLDKDDEDSTEDLPECFSSPETSNKLSPNRGQLVQNSSNAESSSHPEPKQGAESGAETGEPKVDLWKPLNYLVEVANRSKSPTNVSQWSSTILQPHQTPDKEIQIGKTKVKVQEKRDGSDIFSPDEDKPKKLRRIRRKKVASSGDCVISPQTVLDAGTGNGHRRASPIWFSLVASEDQQGDAQLPQISASYLRIKDGTMPVSFIQKYLVRKLDLTSENEVEIKCLGQSVIPTLQLNSLVELWLQSNTSQKVPALIGSSAKDFVMVLAYTRKCPSP